MSLFNELKRRNVIRVAAAYGVFSWLLLQVGDILFQTLELPSIWNKGLLAVILLGLPMALFFSWVYELTPEGLKKESEIGAGQSITTHTARKLNLAIVALLLATMGMLAWQQWREAATSPTNSETTDIAPAAANGKSIAVLPFVNMSNDPEQDYFSDGLSEELLNQLAQVPGLSVVGRTSSFSFKGKNEDLRSVGRKLGVGNILEGSVRRQGNQVRITAQLIRVADGFHLWSESFDRHLDNVFLIQDEISAAVAKALKIVLDQKSRVQMRTAGVRNVEAFVAYQKGKALFARAHGEAPLLPTLREGLKYYDQAIALVPEFGAAYFEKADYYAHVLMSPDTDDSERAAALPALRQVLDRAFQYSDSPTRKAYVDVDRVLFSENWVALRNRIEAALSDPGCPVPTWIVLSGALGYAAEMTQMYQRWQRCEPLSKSPSIFAAYASAWTGSGQASMDLLLAAEQRLGVQHWATRQMILMTLGHTDAAQELTAQISEDSESRGITAQVFPLAASGDLQTARAEFARVVQTQGHDLLQELDIHAALGERQQANADAAVLDARPAGPVLLLNATYACMCGAPFDLSATPRFAARIAQSGLPWPPDSPIHFPAKDW